MHYALAGLFYLESCPQQPIHKFSSMRMIFWSAPICIVALKVRNRVGSLLPRLQRLNASVPAGSKMLIMRKLG